MSRVDPLDNCRTCLRRNGKACGFSGKPLIWHVWKNYCPLGKFPAEIPQDFSPIEEIRRMKSGGCCGKPGTDEAVTDPQ